MIKSYNPLNSLSKLDGEVTGADVVEEITSVNALRMEVLDSEGIDGGEGKGEEGEVEAGVEEVSE